MLFENDKLKLSNTDIINEVVLQQLKVTIINGIEYIELPNLKKLRTNIVNILKEHEDDLSDGYKYYIPNRLNGNTVDVYLLNIADEIMRKIINYDN